MQKCSGEEMRNAEMHLLKLNSRLNDEHLLRLRSGDIVHVEDPAQQGCVGQFVSSRKRSLQGKRHQVHTGETETRGLNLQAESAPRDEIGCIERPGRNWT